MATPLLTTKLKIPPVRPELVPRPRLFECLDAGLDRKLTLVSAPAGFGKTTLLSKWVHDGDGTKPRPPVAWLSLDDDDDELARFWTYLIAAIQKIHPDFGADVLRLLQSH
jgi:LuxR family maltose regulon positive regulatory protein